MLSRRLVEELTGEAPPPGEARGEAADVTARLETRSPSGAVSDLSLRLHSWHVQGAASLALLVVHFQQRLRYRAQARSSAQRVILPSPLSPLTGRLPPPGGAARARDDAGGAHPRLFL